MRAQVLLRSAAAIALIAPLSLLAQARTAADARALLGLEVSLSGTARDTLGVVASPECMRVGSNLPSHGAFWTMAFSDGAPSFVMCCLDQP